MKHYTDDDLCTQLLAGEYTYETALLLGSYNPEAFDIDDWIREPEIISIQTRDSIFGGSNPCIGACCSRQLTAKIFTGVKDNIIDVIDPSGLMPRDGIVDMIPAWVATRIISTTNPAQGTQWHVAGAWYVKKSIYDPTTGTMTITAYDAMVDTDSAYMKIEWRQCFQNNEETMLMSAVLWDICEILGCGGLTDKATQLITTYNTAMKAPDEETTMRQILQWIGGICGCNVRIKWTSDTYARGAIDLVPFQLCGDRFDIGMKYGSIKFGELSDTSDYWDVSMRSGYDDNDYTSTKTEQTIVTTRFEMDNPLCQSTSQCDAVLSSIRQRDDELIGYSWRYRGATVSDALLDFRAEAGDIVIVHVPLFDGTQEGINLIAGEITRDYNHGLTCTITSPDISKREIDPYVAEEWQ